jgi:Flp pilus assembly protein TadD
LKQGRFDLLTEAPTQPELDFFGGPIAPKAAFTEEPADPPALFSQAREAVDARRFEEAQRLLVAALALAPEDLRVLDLLGFVCFSLRDYAAAEDYNRRALTLAPDHAFAHNGLGLSLARQGKLDEGRAACERAITIEPRWFEPYHDMAVILAEAGRFADACAILDRGTAAAPEATAQFAETKARLPRRA